MVHRHRSYLLVNTVFEVGCSEVKTLFNGLSSSDLSVDLSVDLTVVVRKDFYECKITNGLGDPKLCPNIGSA